MKRLLILAMVVAGAGTLSGCVEYPADVVVVRHSGYYYPYRGYYREGGYWVPGHYDRHGWWHRGHWR